MHGLRILLVEDDDDNRELMAEVLESSGYEVLSAASGQDGLKKLSEHTVDVVVTDVKGIAPKVPVIVVTGWAERDDIARARGRDVDAVLIKPVDPDALTQTVRDVAQGRGRP